MIEAGPNDDYDDDEEEKMSIHILTEGICFFFRNFRHCNCY